jgi:hypothetical protein
MRSLGPNQLTLSFSGVPVNRSRWPASDAEWMTLVVTWPSSPLALCERFGQRGLSSRTSPVCCLRQKDGTLASSSGRWKNAGMGGLIGSSTQGTFLSLNAAEDCSSSVTAPLSAILETGDLPQRHFLSRRVCEGILRRAGERGRRLPDLLRTALRDAAERSR